MSISFSLEDGHKTVWGIDGLSPWFIRAYGPHGSGNQRLKRMERAAPLTTHHPKLWVRHAKEGDVNR